MKFFGETFNSFDKAHPQMGHEELDGVSMRSAAETMIVAISLLNDERGGFLFVKGAKGFVSGSGPLQFEIGV